jgi:hypothetical protein
MTRRWRRVGSSQGNLRQRADLTGALDINVRLQALNAVLEPSSQ